MRLRALESALEKMCAQHRAAGRLDSALAAGMAAVACDPAGESAHRRLALIQMSEGKLAEALRQYHLPPSPQFRRLVAPPLGRPADQTT